MSTNLCQHTHPDGSGCQAHPQTGKSFCFFHDPKQEKNRARAQRNGGFMRGRNAETPPLLPNNVPYLPARTRDDIAQRLEEIFNWLEQNVRDRVKAKALQIYTLNTLSNNLAAEERKEREAARAAERAAAKAAREAQKKDAERQIAGFQPAGSAVNSTEPASPEEPIIIDASQPLDLRRFGGKKPRFTSVEPVFTSILTGKPINFDEPSPLDPPAHLLREPYRSTVPGTAPFGNPKPQVPKPDVPKPPAPPAETTRKDATPHSDTRKDETKVETRWTQNPNNPYTINSLDLYDTTRNRPITYEMTQPEIKRPAPPSFGTPPRAVPRQPEPPRPKPANPEEPPSPRDPSQWVLHPAYKIMKGIK